MRSSPHALLDSSSLNHRSFHLIASLSTFARLLVLAPSFVARSIVTSSSGCDDSARNAAARAAAASSTTARSIELARLLLLVYCCSLHPHSIVGRSIDRDAAARCLSQCRARTLPSLALACDLVCAAAVLSHSHDVTLYRLLICRDLLAIGIPKSCCSFLNLSSHITLFITLTITP